MEGFSMARTQIGTSLPPAKGLKDDLELLTRFYSLATQNPGSDCIIWAGSIAKNGYGKFSLSGKTVLAHRVSVMIKHGRWPGKWVVRHQCNRRDCINPGHLLIGTRSQNEKDKRRRRKPRVVSWEFMYLAVNITRKRSRCEKGR